MKENIFKVVFLTLSIVMFQLNAFSAYSEVEVSLFDKGYDEESLGNITVTGNMNYEIDLFAEVEGYGGYDANATASGRITVAGGLTIRYVTIQNNSLFVTGTHIAEGPNTYAIYANCSIWYKYAVSAMASARVRISW